MFNYVFHNFDNERICSIGVPGIVTPYKALAPVSPVSAQLNPKSQRVYILGDLHGCALKLLKFVMRIGVCHAPEEEFNRFELFYTSYDRLSPFTQDAPIIENESLYQLNLQRTYADDVTILINGDVICDRGKSDYLTLYVISCIKKIGINVEVVLGNHDLYGICAFGLVFPEVSGIRGHLTSPDLSNFSKDINHILLSKLDHFVATYCSRDDSLFYRQALDPPKEPNFSEAFKIKYTQLFLDFLDSVSLIKCFKLDQWTFYEFCEYQYLFCTHAPMHFDVINPDSSFFHLIEAIRMASFGEKNELGGALLQHTVEIENINVLNACVRKFLRTVVATVRDHQLGPLPVSAAKLKYMRAHKLNLCRAILPSLIAFTTNRNVALSTGIKALNVIGHIGPNDPGAGRINLDNMYGRPGELTCTDEPIILGINREVYQHPMVYLECNAQDITPRKLFFGIFDDIEPLPRHIKAINFGRRHSGDTHLWIPPLIEYRHQIIRELIATVDFRISDSGVVDAKTTLLVQMLGDILHGGTVDELKEACQKVLENPILATHSSPLNRKLSRYIPHQTLSQRMVHRFLGRLETF